MEALAKSPAVFMMEHRDGLKTAVLMLSGVVHDFAYAARVDGTVQGTEFHLQNGGPFAHFSYLCLNIEQFFIMGKAPYPPERTLLTTGITDAVMISRHEGHRVVETPYLDVAYESYDEAPIRPKGPRPQGACMDPHAPDIV